MEENKSGCFSFLLNTVEHNITYYKQVFTLCLPCAALS